MKLIHKMIYKEALSRFAATFLVLTLVFIIVTFVSVLGKAASGKIAVHQVFHMLFYSFVAAADKLAPLSFLISATMLIRRMCSDRELSILASTGTGPRFLIRPMVVIGLIISVVTLTLSLILAPEASRKKVEIVQAAGELTRIANLPTGSFERNKDATYLIGGSEETEGIYSDIVVHTSSVGNEGVVRADKGFERLDKVTGDRFLILENGYRVEVEPGKADYTHLEFERFALRLIEKEKTTTKYPLSAFRSTILLNSDNRLRRTEFYWRMSAAITVLVITIYLTFVLQGRRVLTLPPDYLTTLCFYLIYLSLLTTAFTMIRRDYMDPLLGSIGLPLAFVFAMFVVVQLRAVVFPSIWRLFSRA